MAGRHLRTAVGVGFMALGALAVLASRWLDPGAHVGCAASWVELVHKYGFPALLFLSGFTLFHRASFLDLVEGGKQVARRVLKRAPHD